jgi:hypothetical protein
MAVSVTQNGIDQQVSDDKEYVYAMLKKDGIMFYQTKLKTPLQA